MSLLDPHRFETQRGHLLSLAYRMLGSAADAEDVVQESWLRWQAAEQEEIRSDRAWLTAVATRLCLDRLRNEATRREKYPGLWLPEPVATDDPTDRQAVSLAFLALLERLSPAERAAYVLSTAFDYSHAELAEVLGRTETACRQLLHRARARIQEERPRFAPSPEDHTRLVQAFARALEAGDLAGLEKLLAQDAVAQGDGGGKANALKQPLVGAHAIATFFARLVAAMRNPASLEIRLIETNGWTALWVQADEGRGLITLETDGERIHAVRSVLNPDKLARLDSALWRGALG